MHQSSREMDTRRSCCYHSRKLRVGRGALSVSLLCLGAALLSSRVSVMRPFDNACSLALWVRPTAGGFMVHLEQDQTSVAPAGGPRRWRGQRWLIDETIRSNGVEGDQPRLGYTLGPAG